MHPPETMAKAAVLQRLFAFLEQRAVAYVVVGDDRRLAGGHEGDIDLVVAPRDLAGIPALVREFAEHAGVHLVQDIQHEVVARYFVYSWADAEGGEQFLAIDICSDWYRHGRFFMSADQLLGAREAASVPWPGAEAFTWWRPDPASGFLYYLLKKLDKGSLDEVQAGFLSATFARDAQGVQARLGEMLGAEDAALVAEAARSGDWSAVRDGIDGMRARLRRALPRQRPVRVGEGARRLIRFMRPTGLLLHVEHSSPEEFAAMAEALAGQWVQAFRRVLVIADGQPLTWRRYVARIRPQLVYSTLVIARGGPASGPLRRRRDVLSCAFGDWRGGRLDRKIREFLRQRQAARPAGRYLPWSI